MEFERYSGVWVRCGDLGGRPYLWVRSHFFAEIPLLTVCCSVGKLGLSPIFLGLSPIFLELSSPVVRSNFGMSPVCPAAEFRSPDFVRSESIALPYNSLWGITGDGRIMKRILAALCVYVACQSCALAAHQFKVGDRVYVPTMRKYGTVIPGGFQGPRGFNPNIRFDDAPRNSTGGVTLEPALVRRAGAGAPPPPRAENGARTQIQGRTGATTGVPGGLDGQTGGYRSPGTGTGIGLQGQTGGTGGAPGGFGGPVGGIPVVVPNSVNGGTTVPSQTPQQTSTQAVTPTPTPSDPPITDTELPSGNYVCYKITGGGLAGFGSIEIKGRSYRGMNASIGPFIPLYVNGGNISFTGGLKGLEDVRITKSYISRNSSGQPIIVIRHAVTSRGFTTTDGLECACER
jgi:hypothetical protein